MPRNSKTPYKNKFNELDYDVIISDECKEFIESVERADGIINGADAYQVIHYFLCHFVPIFAPNYITPETELLFSYEALKRLKKENEREIKTRCHIEVTSDEIRKEEYNRKKRIKKLL